MTQAITQRAEAIPQWLPSESYLTDLSIFLFKTASLLTDPVCHMREDFWRARIVWELDPDGDAICNYAAQAYYLMSALLNGALAAITTLPAIALRLLAISLQSEPYFHWTTDAPPKSLPSDRSLSVLLWNICGPAGGYAITDGGVLPWRDRIEPIIAKIKEADSDIVLLQEVFESDMAFLLAERLKELGYCDFYLHIHPLAVGTPSAQFIAGRCKLGNPEFTRFPQETLVGRTKNAAKGVFGFDVLDGEESILRILTTHPQQSDESEFPKPATDKEIGEAEARALEMAIVMQKVDEITDRPVLLAGDLNMQRTEFDAAPWRQRIKIGNQDGPTWGGDTSCSLKVGQRPSRALQLDYIGYFDDRLASIVTDYIRTSFNASRIVREALSDHDGLRSVITFKESQMAAAAS